MEDFSLPHTNNLSERELRGQDEEKSLRGSLNPFNTQDIIQIY